MNYLIKVIVIIVFGTTQFSSQSQLYWDIVNIPYSINIGCIAANNQNNIFIGTVGDAGGLYKSTDNCNSWEYFGFENTGIENIVVNSMNLMYLSESKYIYKSNDNGTSWEIIYSYPEPPLNGISEVTCFDENIMYAAFKPNTCGLIRSVDTGINWQVVLTLPSNVEFFYDIEIVNEDTVLACTTNWFDGGGVYRSNDGGDNWEFAGMYDFHCFSLAKNSFGDVYVGTYGHNTQYWLSGVYVLYHGTDEWIQLYSTLVNDMVINTNDHLFVATDYGVLRSTDSGQTFEYINNGLFEGQVNDLAIDSSGFLYASSYDPCNMARSCESTITNINDYKKNDDPITIFNCPNPVSGITNFVISKPKHVDGDIVITLFNANGQLIDKVNSNFSIAEETKIKYDAGKLPAGIYYYQAFINKHQFSNMFIKY
jgi:photosystem II stability/assembly factor-like uncharacterized protein